jgi:hypothetical protein
LLIYNNGKTPAKAPEPEKKSARQEHRSDSGLPGDYY